MPAYPPISPDRHLILVATTTQEKVERFQAIADLKGLPLIFVNLKELAVIRSAVEDRHTPEGNALQKMDECEEVYNACLKRNSNEYKRLERLARKYGVDPGRTDHIHFASDDATFTVPKPVWDKLEPKLKPVVDNNLLISAADNRDQCGPGAETGPILAAGGVLNTFNWIREAAVEAGYKDNEPVPVKNRTTLMMRTLSTPDARPNQFSGSTSTCLLRLPGKNLRDKFETRAIDFDNPDSYFVTSSDFLASPATPSKKANGNLEYNSEGRYEIVEKLMSHFGLAQGKSLPSRMHPSEPMPGNIIALKGGGALADAVMKKANVAVLNFSDGGGSLKKARTIYELLKPIEETISHASALVFTPLDPNADDVSKTKALLYLQSAVVAKQTHPRDLNKPIIVLNQKGPNGEKGGWEMVVEAMLDQARKGMTKDYDPRIYGAKDVGIDGVSHAMTSYMHILSSKDGAKLGEAALRLLGRERLEVPEMPTPEVVPAMRKIAAPKSMYKVAVWTSASSDNKRLLDDLYQFGSHLAREGYGLVWGAGDRHGMGAIYKGYDEARGASRKATWVAGFSTPELLASETDERRIPRRVDFQEINPNIYERMAHMIDHADAMVVAPGGVGTSQEWLSALYARQMLTEIKNKPIILYAPDLLKNDPVNGQRKHFWEKSAAAFFGEKHWEELKANPRAQANEGILLARSKEELEVLLGHLRNEKQRPGSRPTANWKEFTEARRGPSNGLNILQ